MKQTCHMLQEWDSAARKAIRKRQAFNAGAPGVQGGFSPANPPRFAPSAQGCMNIACICPYMGVSLTIRANVKKYLKTSKDFEVLGSNVDRVYSSKWSAIYYVIQERIQVGQVS